MKCLSHPLSISYDAIYPRWKKHAAAPIEESVKRAKLMMSVTEMGNAIIQAGLELVTEELFERNNE